MGDSAGIGAPEGGGVGGLAYPDDFGDPGTLVPLAEILALPDLDLTPVCGADLDTRMVRWAHVSELVDPAPYLLGGELLLTAGVNLPTDPEALGAYIASLAGAGVTALGLGLAPVLTEVPPALVVECERHGLPLLAVPERTPFMAVSRAVAQALEQRRAAHLRGLAEAQSGVARAALNTRFPVPAVVVATAEAVDAWAILLASTGHTVAGTVDAPELTPAVVELAQRLGRATGPRSASEHSGGSHVVLYPVASTRVETRILVLGRPRPFTAPDRTVIAVGVGLLGLLVDSARAAGDQGRLLTHVLLGEDPARGARPAELLRALLGLTTDDADPAAHVRVLRGVRHAPPVAGAPRGPNETATVLLTRAVGSPLVDDHDGRLCAIIPAGVPDDELLALHTEHGWLFAAGRPVPPTHLPEADREARFLLDRAIATTTPIIATGAGPGLGDLVDRSLAQSWARDLLAPITEAGDDLRDVLSTWLANHGNWDRTATATGLHRNSVRHRITRAERLLSTDLTDPTTRAQLWLALTWTGH